MFIFARADCRKTPHVRATQDNHICCILSVQSHAFNNLHFFWSQASFRQDFVGSINPYWSHTTQWLNAQQSEERVRAGGGDRVDWCIDISTARLEKKRSSHVMKKWNLCIPAENQMRGLMFFLFLVFWMKIVFSFFPSLKLRQLGRWGFEILNIYLAKLHFYGIFSFLLLVMKAVN